MPERDANQPPDGYQWDYLGPDPNDQSGEKWGWINEDGKVWTPPPERDANQLAADVRGAFLFDRDMADKIRADAALDELVALVGTLQQERDEVVRLAQGCEAAQRMEENRAVAAEAALAETEAARENWKGLAEERGAALATIRQALTEAAYRTADDGLLCWCSDTYRSSNPRDTHGVRCTVARRALADTGGDTA